MFDIMKTCSFTGHRFIVKGEREALKGKIKQVLSQLIKDGFTDFITGGAIGFDTLAAQSIIELKKENENIKLHLVLPCKNQEIKWSEVQKAEYRRIMLLADSCQYVSEEYTSSCMFERNRKMVDFSSVCVAYYNRIRKGGTYMTVSYAEKKGKRLINLY